MQHETRTSRRNHFEFIKTVPITDIYVVHLTHIRTISAVVLLLIASADPSGAMIAGARANSPRQVQFGVKLLF
jgi:hypothetical protein